jgi:hypothetical protein
MLDTETKKLLKSFFNSTDQLIDKKIIRSSKYTADVAEYLTEKIYDITLCENQREIGYDGVDKQNKKYQVKINNSSQKTNQDIGNIEHYNYLILMITSNSRLFDKRFNEYFITVYKVENKFLKDRKYIAKTYIHNIEPDYCISNKFEIIKN